MGTDVRRRCHIVNSLTSYSLLEAKHKFSAILVNVASLKVIVKCNAANIIGWCYLITSDEMGGPRKSVEIQQTKPDLGHLPKWTFDRKRISTNSRLGTH